MTTKNIFNQIDIDAVQELVALCNHKMQVWSASIGWNRAVGNVRLPGVSCSFSSEVCRNWVNFLLDDNEETTYAQRARALQMFVDLLISQKEFPASCLNQSTSKGTTKTTINHRAFSEYCTIGLREALNHEKEIAQIISQWPNAPETTISPKVNAF